MDFKQIAIGAMGSSALFVAGLFATHGGTGVVPQDAASALTPAQVESFCRTADHVTADAAGPETVGIQRKAAKGTRSIEWKDTGTNGVATYYWQDKAGAQRNAVVEITTEAASCFQTLK